jgi:hypothetical protein
MSDCKSYLGESQKGRATSRARKGNPPRRKGWPPSGADFRAQRYFERFFGLCWFNVEISNFADGGIGTAPCRAISLASILFP